MYKEPSLAQRFYFPIHALKRPITSLNICLSFFKHPFIALKNLSYMMENGSDGEGIVCLGTNTRKGFLSLLSKMKKDYLKGNIRIKPQVWIFQAYCEKPVNGACSPGEASPYTKNNTQKRFNEYCIFSGGNKISKSCNDSCRIGSQITKYEITGKAIDINFKIMLNEKQMVDFWDEMLAYQAKTGTIIPFVMDVCPFALWLAKCSLFQLKTPIGIIFLFQTENRCKTFREYTRADKGFKDSKERVALNERLYREKLLLLEQLYNLAKS